MAVTWTPTITVVDRATRLINFSAVREDSDDPDNPQTYTVNNKNIKTTGQKLAVMDAVVDERVKQLAEAALDALFAAEVTALEAQAKEYLENKEVT